MAYRDFVATFSPLAYWPLDDVSGNFADYTGHGHTATATGTLTYGQTNLTPHTSGGCVDFGGGSASLAHAAWNDITGSWSAMAWVNADSFNSSNGSPILEKYSGSSGGYVLRFRDGGSGNQPRAFNSGGGFSILDDPTGRSLTTTYFVSFTYNGTTGRMYVNGSEVSNATLSAPQTVPTKSLRIGTNGDNQASTWDGRMQHVALWNRVLSPTEVSDLYTATGMDAGGDEEVVVASNKPPLGFIPIA